MNFKVGKYYLLCWLVLLIDLLSNQISRLFGINNHLILLFFYYIKYINSCALLLVALSKKRRIESTDRKKFTRIVAPAIIICLTVEVIAVIMSPVVSQYGLRYFTRSFVIIVERISVYITVLGIWMLLGKEAIKCCVTSALADGIIVFVCAIFRIGISGIITSIESIFLLAENNFFEVHELTFSIGLLLIYLFFFSDDKKLNKRYLFGLVILFVLGDKRIAWGGIIAAGLLSLLVKKKGLSKRMLATIGLTGVFICFLYIFMIYSDFFFTLLSNYSINPMGRDLIFGYFTRRTHFGIDQLGWGIAGVSKVIENWDASEVMYMQSVQGLHNDILKTYINFGAILSFVWFLYNLVYLPRKSYDYFGKKTATILMSFMLYLFVTYMTDNTETYFVCQIFLLLIPLAEYSIRKERI